MQPRQIRDTSKPVRPSFVYSITRSPNTDPQTVPFLLPRHAVPQSGRASKEIHRGRDSRAKTLQLEKPCATCAGDRIRRDHNRTSDITTPHASADPYGKCGMTSEANSSSVSVS